MVEGGLDAHQAVVPLRHWSHMQVVDGDGSPHTLRDEISMEQSMKEKYVETID